MNEPTQVIQGVPEGIRIARLAFLRDFETLMANRKTRGKYVGYHLDKLVAVTRDYGAVGRVQFRTGLCIGYRGPRQEPCGGCHARCVGDGLGLGLDDAKVADIDCESDHRNQEGRS